LGGGDPVDARSANVEHRVAVEPAVDHGVPIEPGQGVELAGDGGELASRGLELSGEDLDLRSGGLEGVDSVVVAPSEPLAKRQSVGRSRLRDPIPGEERQRVGLRSTTSMHLLRTDKDGVRSDDHRQIRARSVPYRAVWDVGSLRFRLGRRRVAGDSLSSLGRQDAAALSSVRR